MPHTPKVDIKALKKSGAFDEARFFRLLSEQNNYVNQDTVKVFYKGLVRLLTAELKENGIVRLPHLGDIALVKQKDKIGWAGQYQRMITGKYMIKFYPKDAWKKYFSKLAEREGYEGSLDPREKLLNRVIE
jgi:nucleoid DNA-binding protein